MLCHVFFFFFKQKTAYEMRISDWSSDVCSSDLRARRGRRGRGSSPLGTRVGRGTRADASAALPAGRLLFCRERRGGCLVGRLTGRRLRWLGGDRKSTRLNSSH